MWPALTPDHVCDAFREAGIVCSPQDIRIEPREERWVVWLPGERIAWFPASHYGLARLENERRVLRLLAERCSFQIPRLIMVSPRGFDLRLMVPGRCDPWGLFLRCMDDPSSAQAIGQSLGAMLAEQHIRIGFTDVRGGCASSCPGRSLHAGSKNAFRRSLTIDHRSARLMVPSPDTKRCRSIRQIVHWCMAISACTIWRSIRSRTR
jgi:hypothetical protein